MRVKVYLHPETALPLQIGDKAKFFYAPGYKNKSWGRHTEATAKEEILSKECFLDINNYELWMVANEIDTRPNRHALW